MGAVGAQSSGKAAVWPLPLGVPDNGRRPCSRKPLLSSRRGAVGAGSTAGQRGVSRAGQR